MLAKLFIGLGVALVAIGIALRYAPWLLGWFGRLPGDIDISRDGNRVFIPITSTIIVSLVLSLALSFWFRR